MGLVKAGKFIAFGQESKIKLSATDMRAGRGPDSLDLTKYDGKVIIVSGNLHDSTIYRATIVDEAGHMLTAVVFELFGKRSKT